MKWEKYDTGWRVELAKKQNVKESIIDLLEKCTQCIKESDAYIWFVPKEDIEDYYQNTCIGLYHPDYGDINIDVSVKRNDIMFKEVILGVEFVGLIK